MIYKKEQLYIMKGQRYMKLKFDALKITQSLMKKKLKVDNS